MSLIERFLPQVRTFIKVCHQLAANKYVTGYGGNLAWKLEEEIILITPTQMNKGDIQLEDIVFIRPDGTTLEGSRRPTGETAMYINFFRERPDIQSVIHCHPPMTNAFAISKGKNWLMRPLFPETVTEVGPVPVVPYALPLTQQLADNFLPYLQKYNAFIMENHGLVIMSRLDLNWTMMNTELLEMTALHILNATQLGDIKEIPRTDVIAMDSIMTSRNLPFMGAQGMAESLGDIYDWPA